MNLASLDPARTPGGPLETEADVHSLLCQGHEAAQAGKLAEAGELLATAVELARQEGDPDLLDLAICNHAAVRIELGAGREELSRLRQILVRSGEPGTACRAAYNAARALELDKCFKKALFYARAARDHAYRAASTDWQARAHNLLGNLLLAESQIEDAVREYDQALELFSSEHRHWIAYAWANLGYAHVVQGRRQEGFTLLYRSLRALRRLGDRTYQPVVHVSLSFAYLEVGRWRPAERHGLAALRLAEELGLEEERKKALYLSGQAAAVAGNELEARRRFSELQSSYYPDNADIADFLMAVDVLQLVNLKA